MGNYDDCLDLIVEFFNINSSKRSWHDAKGVDKVVSKIKNLPDDEIIPALANLSPKNCIDTLYATVNTIVNSTQSYSDSYDPIGFPFSFAYRNTIPPYSLDNFVFSRDKNKLLAKDSVKDLTYEIRFKNDENFNYNNGSKNIISTDAATAMIGTPVFCMDNNIINKCFDDIIDYANNTKNISDGTIYQVIRRRINHYMLERVHNNFYTVNTDMIKDYIEKIYSPSKIVNAKGESATVFIYVYEEFSPKIEFLMYSLQDNDEWTVLPKIGNRDITYILQSRSSNNVVTLTLRNVTHKEYYLFKKNNEYVISDKKPNSNISYNVFDLPDNVDYHFNYLENKYFLVMQ